jgi:hypothetical protein
VDSPSIREISAQTEEKHPNERDDFGKDAATLKARHQPGPAAALPPNQHWYFFNFASVQAALNYLNTPLVQSAGEVSATARNDGTVGMYTIYPPTAPLQHP